MQAHEQHAAQVECIYIYITIYIYICIYIYMYIVIYIYIFISVRYILVNSELNLFGWILPLPVVGVGIFLYSDS